MKLLGIVSILLFLSFLGTILNLLLFYLSPLISNVQCYFDDFLHQFIVKAGLMFIAFQMIIATILHESSSLSCNETSGWYVSYDLCLLKQKERKGKKRKEKKIAAMKILMIKSFQCRGEPGSNSKVVHL